MKQLIIFFLIIFLYSCSAKKVAITDRSVVSFTEQKDSIITSKTTLNHFLGIGKMVSYEEVEEQIISPVIDSIGRVVAPEQKLVKRKIWTQKQTALEAFKITDSTAITTSSERTFEQKNDISETALPKNNTAMWIFFSLLLIVLLVILFCLRKVLF